MYRVLLLSLFLVAVSEECTELSRIPIGLPAKFVDYLVTEYRKVNSTSRITTQTIGRELIFSSCGTINETLRLDSPPSNDVKITNKAQEAQVIVFLFVLILFISLMLALLALLALDGRCNSAEMHKPARTYDLVRTYDRVRTYGPYYSVIEYDPDY